ncbi:MAG: hypothetical protein LBJ60_08690 [Tannerellaceae bacterium]|jgi:hypothetical protein|nr:hypothetical protein [Tannerellaceae bacterium]
MASYSGGKPTVLPQIPDGILVKTFLWQACALYDNLIFFADCLSYAASRTPLLFLHKEAAAAAGDKRKSRPALSQDGSRTENDGWASGRAG